MWEIVGKNIIKKLKFGETHHNSLWNFKENEIQEEESLISLHWNTNWLRDNLHGVI